jgi:Domain of unknown function (DUF4826)
LPDYNDPAVEEQWCAERRAEVTAYLQRERVDHGRVGEWPAWHVAPYVSIWAIESKQRPGWVGWWAICGDLPTDYVSAETIKEPRDAVRSIAEVARASATHGDRQESSRHLYRSARGPGVSRPLARCTGVKASRVG